MVKSGLTVQTATKRQLLNLGKFNMKYIILLLPILLSGCSYEDKTQGHSIDAVYWHENEQYTAKVIEPDNSVTDYRLPPWGAGERNSMHLYLDVLPDEQSWYSCTWKYRGLDGSKDCRCEIHIHNLDELGTADWNHGKFGSGSTTRID